MLLILMLQVGQVRRESKSGRSVAEFDAIARVKNPEKGSKKISPETQLKGALEKTDELLKVKGMDGGGGGVLCVCVCVCVC